MRLIRQLLSAVLGAMILVSALAVAPASAHDAADSTSPAQGATVATPPEKVSVTFNRNPLSLGSEILVTDAAGNNWADGSVEIVDNVASQRLRPGAPAGMFAVAWRVVSSDSHPIEGSFTFTAGVAESGASAASPATPEATAGTAPAEAAPAEAAKGGTFAGLPAVLLTAGVIAVLLAGLGVVLARRRNRSGSTG